MTLKTHDGRRLTITSSGSKFVVRDGEKVVEVTDSLESLRALGTLSDIPFSMQLIDDAEPWKLFGRF